MNLAVIPARGGSKRIPRKNIKDFCGKPIIAWSIDAAQSAQCFDRIIVSTEDEEIAKIATEYGAEIPFMRPERLADDYTETTTVVCHAVEQITKESGKPDFVCCIYATAPFIRTGDILTGLKVLKSSHADYALSVTSYAFPIQRAVRITSRGRLKMLNPEYLHTRSQDVEEAYHDAGQFYWGTARAWLSETPLLGTYSAGIILPRYRVQDIDTQEDWIRAERLFNSMTTERKES